MHFYKSHMDLGPNAKLAHFEALTDGTFRFVSLQKADGFGFIAKDEPRQRFFLTVPSLDPGTVRALLAQINECSSREVELMGCDGYYIAPDQQENVA